MHEQELRITRQVTPLACVDLGVEDQGDLHWSHKQIASLIWHYYALVIWPRYVLALA